MVGLLPTDEQAIPDIHLHAVPGLDRLMLSNGLVGLVEDAVAKPDLLLVIGQLDQVADLGTAPAE